MQDCPAFTEGWRCFDLRLHGSLRSFPCSPEVVRESADLKTVGWPVSVFFMIGRCVTLKSVSHIILKHVSLKKDSFTTLQEIQIVIFILIYSSQIPACFDFEVKL